MNSEAKCCCGALSIEISGEPLLSAVCHCDDCKKRTGSAFGLSVYVKDEQVVQQTGKSNVYEVNADFKQQRNFCVNCGTTLFWKVDSLPDFTGIAGGCFTDNKVLEPTHTNNDKSKCPWVNLPDGLKTEIDSSVFE